MIIDGRDVATHLRKYLAVLFEALNVLYRQLTSIKNAIQQRYWSCYARIFLLVTFRYLFLLRLRFTRPKTLLYGVFLRELAIKHAERFEQRCEINYSVLRSNTTGSKPTRAFFSSTIFHFLSTVHEEIHQLPLQYMSNIVQ